MSLPYSYGSTLAVPPQAKIATSPITTVSNPFQESKLGNTWTNETKPHVQKLDCAQEPSAHTCPDCKSGVEFEAEINEKINLPFAIQQLDRTTSLVLLPLCTDLHGNVVIQEIKDTQRRISMARPFLQKTINIFATVVIGTATVRQLFGHDQEQCNRTTMCHIENLKQNTLLSYLFHHPSQLRNRSDFIANNNLFETNISNLDDAIIDKKVLVLRMEIDKLLVTLVVGFLMVISIVVGIVFGACTHSTEAGLSLAGVLVTLVCGFLPVAVCFNSAV